MEVESISSIKEKVRLQKERDPSEQATRLLSDSVINFAQQQALTHVLYVKSDLLPLLGSEQNSMEIYAKAGEESLALGTATRSLDWSKNIAQKRANSDVYFIGETNSCFSFLIGHYNKEDNSKTYTSMSSTETYSIFAIRAQIHVGSSFALPTPPVEVSDEEWNKVAISDLDFDPNAYDKGWYSETLTTRPKTNGQ